MSKKKPIWGWFLTCSLLLITGLLVWVFQKERPATVVDNARNAKRPPAEAVVARAWKEPDSFMGIKFGEDLRSSLPRCPAVITETRELCWRHAGSGDDYEIWNTGLGQVTARLLSSKLEYLTIEFTSIHGAELLAILSERYGPPLTLKTEPWKSKAGASFDNTIAEWIGKNISIRFEERFATRDEGIIIYSSAAWRADAEQKRQQKIKEEAGRL